MIPPVVLVGRGKAGGKSSVMADPRGHTAVCDLVGW